MINVPQPIKNLGNAALGKAANKFVDFIITKYTGKSIKVFEAEAEIEANKVRTKWEVLEKPFWLHAEATKMERQYLNMGNVLTKAAPLIQASENKITDDNDVFWGLLEHSKEISNEKMQQLISKILAGEYNASGTYSMSTLQVIKMLGKSELELFEKIGSLLIFDDQLPQVLFTNQCGSGHLREGLEIDFRDLQLLQSLGLFLPNTMKRTMQHTEKKNILFFYFDKKIIYFPENENSTKIKFPDFYGLSVAGKQILKHLKPKYMEDYYTWLKNNYKITNYKLME